MDNLNALKEINTFFETSLREYYLSIDSNDFNFRGEGYAITGQNKISFFNDKMEQIYSILLDLATEAKINGMHRDDITMKFKEEVTINAER